MIRTEYLYEINVLRRKLNESNKRNSEMRKWLTWIAAHSVSETEIPGNDYPYLNMPPNEGAMLALNNRSISDFDET